jgi:hypothetical protein
MLGVVDGVLRKGKPRDFTQCLARLTGGIGDKVFSAHSDTKYEITEVILLSLRNSDTDTLN